VADFDVNIYGLVETKRLMRELEPELLKQMNSEIKAILQPVAARAKSLIPIQAPLSGWEKAVHAPGSRRPYSPYATKAGGSRSERLKWDGQQARSQVVIRASGGRRRGRGSQAAWQIRSNNPAAAAFELMGRGKSNTNMVKNVTRKYPQSGRLLYRAFDEFGEVRITKKVVGTIRRFEKMFNERLDAAGGR
jgi:hypothetical protein